MAEYQVHLERSRDASGHLGSFGLSILGGYGTKFPAVVCEVDPGGPADGTGLVCVCVCVRACVCVCAWKCACARTVCGAQDTLILITSESSLCVHVNETRSPFIC